MSENRRNSIFTPSPPPGCLISTSEPRIALSLALSGSISVIPTEPLPVATITSGSLVNIDGPWIGDSWAITSTVHPLVTFHASSFKGQVTISRRTNVLDNTDVLEHITSGIRFGWTMTPLFPDFDAVCGGPVIGPAPGSRDILRAARGPDDVCVGYTEVSVILTSVGTSVANFRSTVDTSQGLWVLLIALLEAGNMIWVGHHFDPEND